MDVSRQGNDNYQAARRPQAAQEDGKRNIGGLVVKVVLALVVAVLVVGVLTVGQKFLGSNAAIKGKQYQAVFLTNGQVYFGKVSNIDSGYVKLTDIYYLQVQQNVQPKDQSSSNNNQQVSLAKLGGELHGPEDVMYIARDQVLFWENLKGDGKVAKAISDYKAGGNK